MPYPPNIMTGDIPANQAPPDTTIFNHLSYEDKLELLDLLQEKELRSRRNFITTFFPNDGPLRRELYKKHMRFYEQGRNYHQRVICAANQVGKTTGFGVEWVFHVTGRYPIWWQGYRFSKPQNWWVCGVSWKDVKEVLQDKLIGEFGHHGEGLIPYDCIDFDSMVKPTKNETPIPSFRVLHTSGDYSNVTFKSYESGRESFQGKPNTCIWLDEEPPLAIYSECLARTTVGETMLVMTFTPLKGTSDMIMNYMPDGWVEEGKVGDGKYVINIEQKDVPHIDEKRRLSLEASYHPHVREARTRGIPSLGSGAIYPVPESTFVIEPFDIPKHWKKGFGMDVGWNRTAVIWFAQDPTDNCWHGYSEHYLAESPPAIHAQGILSRGSWIPGVIDSAANGRTQDDGKRLMDEYRKLGLDIENADKSIDTGLLLCWQMLMSGQIKIHRNLTNFLHEIRNYQRDEKGRIVKKNDHLMDAFRYFIMSGRDRASQEPIQMSAAYGVSSQYRVRPVVGGWK